MADAFMEAPTRTFYIGDHLPNPNGPMSQAMLQAANATGYDMVTSYITNLNFKTRVLAQVDAAREQGQTRLVVPGLDAEEINIIHDIYTSQLVAYASPWIELDSLDPLMANASRQVLVLELAYAAFCGLSIVVVQAPSVKNGNVTAFAQGMNLGLQQSNFCSVLLEVPMTWRTREGESPLESWDLWNTVRTVCKYNARLSIALQIPRKLPAEYVQQRWLAEPVRILSISSKTFLLNSKGYPVFSKEHQQLLQKYMKMKPYIILSDTRHEHNTPPTSTPDIKSTTEFPPLSSATLAERKDDPLSFLCYIRHLHKSLPSPTTVERFGAGYQDFLQTPLQPLADNLESITYEVFEKDPVKYDQYEKAITLALQDRLSRGDKSVVVAVVGAGRGPLVTRCLRASATSGLPITLYAIEKNPNAYVTLLRTNRDVWMGAVTVVKTDMRTWLPPSPVDILVSELLGSFGDNELSPECLDGVQRILEVERGISIPQNYTAHYTPIMAPKIHADIVSRVAVGKDPGEHLDVGYVVMLTAVELLSQLKDGKADIQCAWEFKHPLSPMEVLQNNADEGNKNEHNERECKGTFEVPNRGVVHGIAGYFESVLYKSKRTGEVVELSTRPDTIDAKSCDMISWFPIYFPLKAPLYLPDDSSVDISFWRMTDGRKVWYEWMAESFMTVFTGPVGDGEDKAKLEGVPRRRIRLAGTEVSSSKKNGCLM